MWYTLFRKNGGAVAQLGERLVRNQEVRGSIPLCSTTSKIRDFGRPQKVDGHLRPLRAAGKRSRIFLRVNQWFPLNVPPPLWGGRKLTHKSSLYSKIRDFGRPQKEDGHLRPLRAAGKRSRIFLRGNQGFLSTFAFGELLSFLLSEGIEESFRNKVVY